MYAISVFGPSRKQSHLVYYCVISNSRAHLVDLDSSKSTLHTLYGLHLALHRAVSCIKELIYLVHLLACKGQKFLAFYLSMSHELVECVLTLASFRSLCLLYMSLNLKR